MVAPHVDEAWERVRISGTSTFYGSDGQATPSSAQSGW